MRVSAYWNNHNKTLEDRRADGKTWTASDGRVYCDECCTGMITQDGPCNHFDRESCPFCLGTGQPKES